MTNTTCRVYPVIRRIRRSMVFIRIFFMGGYAAGACGSGGGTVDSCEETGGGGFTFAYTCNEEDHQPVNP